MNLVTSACRGRLSLKQSAAGAQGEIDPPGSFLRCEGGRRIDQAQPVFSASCLRNVEAARGANRLLLIQGPSIESLDYTGGVAAGLIREMAELAPVARRGELLRFLARPWPAVI